MHDEDEVFLKWDWQKLVKMGTIIVVVFFFLRAIYTMFIAQDELGQLENILQKQKAQFQQLHQEGDAEVKKIQDGMENGAKEMEKKGEELSNRLNDFFNDFHDSLQAEHERDVKSQRETFTKQFFEDHVRYYDAGLYEADRTKATKERNFPLPNYQEYVAVRDKAFRCIMELQNKNNEKYYKNKIAQLKAEGKERSIKDVEKPDIWTWPLTSEQIEKIKIDYFPRIFTFMTPEGECYD